MTEPNRDTSFAAYVLGRLVAGGDVQIGAHLAGGLADDIRSAAADLGVEIPPYDVRVLNGMARITPRPDTDAPGDVPCP